MEIYPHYFATHFTSILEMQICLKTAAFFLKTNLTSSQIESKKNKYNSEEYEESAIAMFKKKKKLASNAFSQTHLHMIAQKMKPGFHSIVQGQEVAYKYAYTLLSEPIITLPWLRWNSFITVWSSPSVLERLLRASSVHRDGRTNCSPSREHCYQLLSLP